MTHKYLTRFLLSGLLCAGLNVAVRAQTASPSTSDDSASIREEDNCGSASSLNGDECTTRIKDAYSGAASSDDTSALKIAAGGHNLSQTSANRTSSTRNYSAANQDYERALLTTPKAPLPQIVKSEFERFVEDAAGHPLPVYGRQLFGQPPTTFAPMEQIPVPADYVLGPGDQLHIHIWKTIDLESTVTVDRNGQIFIPKIGTFTVAGLHFQQINAFLKSAVGYLYRGFDLNVTMGQLRSIQIFVLGNARQPGMYTVSSLSTLVNALFVSGGPAANGSMRNIQLLRNNQIVTKFDIYDLLRKGDKSHDVQLFPGDVIYISPVGPQVAIYGSINEPGIYELKDEATIATALKSAGGVTNLAELDRVLLERIENHRQRRVDDFSLDETGLQRILHDGDMLELFPISPRFKNAVTLRGNVETPGHFPWHDGLRVADLIPTRDFLITRGYWQQQNHIGRDALLENYGPQRKLPREATNGDTSNMTDSDLRPKSMPIDMISDLAQGSAEINWEYAAIARLDEHDLSTHVIAFNLGKAIDDPSSSEDQILRPGDVITIFARKDIQLPEDKHAAFVRVGGEVNAPGVYRIDPGETLRSVVQRAGGLTTHSYLYASQLNRVSTRMAEEKQMQISINQMQRELISNFAAAPTLTTTSTAQQQAQMASQQALITHLSSIHPTGRIVLDMKSRASSVADIPDFLLEDGDTFYIPPKFGTVQVSGAVYNENAFRYQPRKCLAEYLKDAGGPNRQADAKRVYLIRADGTVVNKQSHKSYWNEDFGKTILLPGDAIIVPTKVRSVGGFSQQLPYVTQMISQTALTGAVLGSY